MDSAGCKLNFASEKMIISPYAEEPVLPISFFKVCEGVKEENYTFLITTHTSRLNISKVQEEFRFWSYHFDTDRIN